MNHVQKENIYLSPDEIHEIEKCIEWSAQNGYYKAEEAAKIFGRLIGEEMYLDQAYYNSYAWRNIKES